MEIRSLTYMLFSFQGRMSRSEYWLRYVVPLLLLYVGLLVLLLVISLVFGVVQSLTTASAFEQGGGRVRRPADCRRSGDDTDRFCRKYRIFMGRDCERS